MKRLPNKPSQLLRLAMNDLEIIEKDPRYEIDMAEYHYRADGFTCLVCMAGAVMANTMKLDYTKYAHPISFPDETRQKLFAINSLRCGDVVEALVILGLKMKYGLCFKATDYHKDKEAFKFEMEFLIIALQEEGL